MTKWKVLTWTFSWLTFAWYWLQWLSCWKITPNVCIGEVTFPPTDSRREWEDFATENWRIEWDSLRILRVLSVEIENCFWTLLQTSYRFLSHQEHKRRRGSIVIMFLVIIASLKWALSHLFLNNWELSLFLNVGKGNLQSTHSLVSMNLNQALISRQSGLSKSFGDYFKSQCPKERQAWRWIKDLYATVVASNFKIRVISLEQPQPNAKAGELWIHITKQGEISSCPGVAWVSPGEICKLFPKFPLKR